MNLIDLSIVALIALSLLLGAYRGFLRTLFNTLALLLCMGLALLCTPLLSNVLNRQDGILGACIRYTEGASRIVSLEDARLPVGQIEGEKLAELVEKADFPSPVPKLLMENLTQRVYNSEGLYALEDYFNRSLEDISLNLLSCFLLLVLFYTVLSLLIACIDAAVRFPVLTMGDAFCGLLMGLLRGVLLCMGVFLLFPIVLSVIPSGISFVDKMLEGSRLFSFFMDKNILFWGIHGTI